MNNIFLNELISIFVCGMIYEIFVCQLVKLNFENDSTYTFANLYIIHCNHLSTDNILLFGKSCFHNR
jgi:hypothetical protein